MRLSYVVTGCMAVVWVRLCEEVLQGLRWRARAGELQRAGSALAQSIWRLWRTRHSVLRRMYRWIVFVVDTVGIDFLLAAESVCEFAALLCIKTKPFAFQNQAICIADCRKDHLCTTTTVAEGPKTSRVLQVTLVGDEMTCMSTWRLAFEMISNVFKPRSADVEELQHAEGVKGLWLVYCTRRGDCAAEV
ncbi:hypothetical protein FB567DRAFT_555365 [Paraphoma chrysanthemicola]|uniref:Uncharacterized protein n=1 Tax=Paraphoma chrysanthemicola TaxID=798071 RepID=A0A8K0QTY5_9PLEO|nr:hypothetical protein FB567DRAFT_555365 [Paraphoma chrysanthemicola]